MPGSSAVLRDLFARHPSAMGTGSMGGHYRIFCESCGEVLSVAIPNPPPPSFEIRCDHCGWSERLGDPAPAADGSPPVALEVPI